MEKGKGKWKEREAALYIRRGIFEYGVGKASWSAFKSSSVRIGQALQLQGMPV